MPSPEDTIDLVSFAPGHLEGALRLSRQAGWPHRLEDWKMALALSEGAVACDETGRVLATVLVTPYGNDTATVNMVIVDETLRGRGIGRQLMDTALTHGGGRPLRLVATAEGLPLYEKLGFRPTGTVLQHQGTVASVDMPGATEDATAADLAAIVALDTAAFGADRMGLIERIAEAGTFAVLRGHGKIEGFSAFRAFGRGHVIGPVVARTLEDAKSLVAHFLARNPGRFLRVDTTVDAGLGDWLAGQGLAHVGGGIAMMRPSPAAPVDAQPAAIHARSAFSTYALANQALG